MAIKNYKKFSRKNLPFFGVSYVFFNNELIGVLDMQTKLVLNITEEWQDYKSDSTGNNVLESKLTGININGSIEFISNDDTLNSFMSIFTLSDKISGKIINLIQSLGTSSVKGELKIVRQEDNKEIIINKCILKSSLIIDLNNNGYKKITAQFISIPEIINNEYVLMSISGEKYFSFSSFSDNPEFGDSGLDKGVFKE